MVISYWFRGNSHGGGKPGRERKGLTRRPGKFWQESKGLTRREEMRLPWGAGRARLRGMSTITAILEPDADDTLHLPVPEELKPPR